MSPEKTLLIPKIENGFVLDHIPTGRGVKVLSLIRAHKELDEAVISVGLHYSSQRLGHKDLIKVQCSQLPQSFLQHLSLIVPGVTIKRIENFGVAQKLVLEPTELIDNLLTCPNPGCITNHERDVTTCFHLVKREPMKFRCNHCERWFALPELESRLKLI